MSLVVKVLGRSRLLGGGRDVNGIAKNAKERVWGELTGSFEAYTQDTSGLAFTPEDLKLLTFDFLKLVPITLDGTDAEGTIEPTTAISAQYSESDEFLVFQTIAENGDRAVADTKAYVVNFEAIGDSADAPELA